MFTIILIKPTGFVYIGLSATQKHPRMSQKRSKISHRIRHEEENPPVVLGISAKAASWKGPTIEPRTIQPREPVAWEGRPMCVFFIIFYDLKKFVDGIYLRLSPCPR